MYILFFIQSYNANAEERIYKLIKQAENQQDLGIANQNLISALDITKATLSNVIYKKNLEELMERVKQGKPLSDFLQERESLFPSVLSRMIGVGEKTGSLEETLMYLGNFHESELDRSLKTFTTVFEPFLLLVVGLVIGFVALAIISPIYEVTRGLYS